MSKRKYQGKQQRQKNSRTRSTMFARRIDEREPYDVVLIVCEGEKTERVYLEGLKGKFRLSNANIKVLSAVGTDVKSIAQTVIAEHNNSGQEYDRIFCVFDLDTRPDIAAFWATISQSAPELRPRVTLITSNPCFEIWVLLHFSDATAPFAPARNRSACDNVVVAVTGHMTNYTKAMKGIFDQLYARIDTALRNARRLEVHNRTTASPNPATDVHKLVTYLQQLKQAHA